MKKSFKITALLLIVLFLIQAFPMISAGKQEFSMPPEEEEVLEEGLVKELKDLRTADSQTYLRAEIFYLCGAQVVVGFPTILSESDCNIFAEDFSANAFRKNNLECNCKC